MKSKFALSVCVLAIAATCLVPQAANACGGVRCWLLLDGVPIAHGTCYILAQAQLENPGSALMRMDSLTVTPLGNGLARLTVDGIESTGMTAEDECATALELVDGIAAVTAVRILDGDTRKPLQELQFKANSRITDELSAEAARTGIASPTTRWAGFHGTVTGAVPEGRSLTYVFDVKLAERANLARVVRTLKSDGLFGLAAATAGALNADHTHFEPLGNHVFLEFPTSAKPTPIIPRR